MSVFEIPQSEYNGFEITNAVWGLVPGSFTFNLEFHKTTMNKESLPVKRVRRPRPKSRASAHLES